MNDIDDGENIGGLIDFSVEDDFLIDKGFDNSSVDLRLSVAFENQMELACDVKPRACVGNSDRIQYLADKESKKHEMQRKSGYNVRNSLAWDNAFFTSPGFLELEELSLVNRGFKDPQRKSVCGELENVRRKVCLERNSSHKAGIPAARRHNTRPQMRTKLTTPTKMIVMRDSQHQLMTAGVISKSQVTQSTTNRKEFLKSGKATGQNRFPIAHNKKSPLQGVSRNWKSKTPERLVSVLTRNTPVNTSVDLLPYNSKDYAGKTVNMTISAEVKGECISESHSVISGDCQINQQSQQCFTKHVNSERVLQRQNATKATKSSLSSQNQLSPTSLRLPSQNLDYFDTKSAGLSTVVKSPLMSPEAHWKIDEKLVTNVSTSLHTPTNDPKSRLNTVKPKRTPPMIKERKAHTRNNGNIHQENPEIRKKTNLPGKDEKENMFLSKDTVIELDPKQHSPLHSQLGVNGSSISSKPSRLSRKSPILEAQKQPRQSKVSPIGNTRKPFSTRVSPLNRSAFF